MVMGRYTTAWCNFAAKTTGLACRSSDADRKEWESRQEGGQATTDTFTCDSQITCAS